MNHATLASAVAAFLWVAVTGAAGAFDVEAGPIWNNDDAAGKCPQVCQSHGGWNGNWTTTIPGKMSVCGCNREEEDGATAVDAAPTNDAGPAVDAAPAATGGDDAAEPIYRVIVNHEEQYSIWPDGRETPLGWRDTGFSGEKQACLDHIAEVWTDMRPLSLRKKMEEDARNREAEGQ